MTHCAEVVDLASVRAERERIRREENLVVSWWLLTSLGLGAALWTGAVMVAMGMWWPGR
jgi:hypothetical protein